MRHGPKLTAASIALSFCAFAEPALAQEALLPGVWRCESMFENVHLVSHTTYWPDGTGTTESTSSTIFEEPDSTGPIPIVIEGKYNFDWSLDGTSLTIAERERIVKTLIINNVAVDPGIFPGNADNRRYRLVLKRLTIDELVLRWGDNGDETCARE